MCVRSSAERSFCMRPVEADGKFDAKAEMRGSGAWRLIEWKASQAVRYERNPDWHLPPPYIQNLEMPIISEYAQRRAQLVSGAVQTYLPNSMERINAEDIVAAKK